MMIQLIWASLQIDRLMTLAFIVLVVIAVLTISNYWWNLLRRMAFDCVAIYAAIATARDDGSRRKVELEMWQLQGRASIKDRRATLQAGNAAMWKAGKYDILVDEVIR